MNDEPRCTSCQTFHWKPEVVSSIYSISTIFGTITKPCNWTKTPHLSAADRGNAHTLITVIPTKVDLNYQCPQRPVKGSYGRLGVFVYDLTYSSPKAQGEDVSHLAVDSVGTVAPMPHGGHEVDPAGKGDSRQERGRVSSAPPRMAVELLYGNYRGVTVTSHHPGVRASMGVASSLSYAASLSLGQSVQSSETESKATA